MGLGPAVCQHCQVVAEHQYIDKHPFHRIWCKFCGETNIKDSAGMSEKRWKQLNENKLKLEKFYNFVKGIDDDNNNGSSSKEDS